MQRHPSMVPLGLLQATMARVRGCGSRYTLRRPAQVPEDVCCSSFRVSIFHSIVPLGLTRPRELISPSVFAYSCIIDPFKSMRGRSWPLLKGQCGRKTHPDGGGTLPTETALLLFSILKPFLRFVLDSILLKRRGDTPSPLLVDA